MKVTFDNGSVLVGTPNHPIAIGPNRFVAIKDLFIGDLVLCSNDEQNRKAADLSGENTQQVPLVRKTDSYSSIREAQVLPVRAREARLLLDKLYRCFPLLRCFNKAYLKRASGNALRADETQQSNESLSQQGKDEDQSAGKRLEAPSTRRERTRTDRSSTPTGIHFGMAYGVSHIDWPSARGLSALLQVGYSERDAQSGDRSGRYESRVIVETGQRQEETVSLGTTRVDHIEVLEQGSDGTFGGMCPGGYVYNLEVEDTHTYLANGIAVHNCHEAPGKLSDYIGCKLYEKDLGRFSDYPRGEDVPEWVEWAKSAVPLMDAEIRTTEMELVHLGRKVTKVHMDVLNHLKRLASYISRLSFATGDDWIVDKEEGTKYGRAWKFDSVFPGKYAERYLFCGVPKVLVMSATLKPKTMYELGVKRDEFAYRSWRRIFPATRHKIYQVYCRKENGSAIRIDRRTSDADKSSLIAWVDREIIKPRLDRKGLIQTVSYDLQKVVMGVSEYSRYMIGNTSDPDSGTASDAAEEFRKSKPPAILVSPSFSTGWDFPASQCEYIIIMKVPFEAQTKIYKARESRDELYGAYRAMQKVEQGSGRGMRFDLDRCEVFLVDGHFVWFLNQYKSLAQDGFVDGIQKVVTVPKPPKSLREE